MQEPGNEEELYNGIRYVRPGNNFEPSFDLFRKVEVNGMNEHPLFSFLKKNCPPTRDFFAPQEKLFYKPLHNNDIRWNFEKFLIDRRGRPVMRFDPSTRGSILEEHIVRLLKEEVPKSETDFVQIHF